MAETRAEIKGFTYPVIVLKTRVQEGCEIATVKVLPRSDGYQPKPFKFAERSGYTIYSEVGDVLGTMLVILD
jgi:hypothetical protein